MKKETFNKFWSFDYERLGDTITLDYDDYMTLCADVRSNWESAGQFFARMNKWNELLTDLIKIHQEVVDVENATSTCKNCKVDYPCITMHEINYFRKFIEETR